LELSSPVVGLSVERGEAIARENRYHLINYVFTFLPASPFITNKHISCGHFPLDIQGHFTHIFPPTKVIVIS